MNKIKYNIINIEKTEMLFKNKFGKYFIFPVGYKKNNIFIVTMNRKRALKIAYKLNKKYYSGWFISNC